MPHALTFPGAFAPGGLLGAQSQTTAWLYVFWHGGFPLFVIAYALLHRREADGTVGALASTGRAIAAASAAVAALTIVTLAAMLTLWQRPQRMVDLWLMLVMWIWLFDIALAAIIGSSRFDLGFYAGRIFGPIAASFLLITHAAGGTGEIVRRRAGCDGRRRKTLCRARPRARAARGSVREKPEVFIVR